VRQESKHVQCIRYFFKFFQTDNGNVSRLTQALLRQIEAQRNGEVIDSGLLKQVIAVHVELLSLRIRFIQPERHCLSVVGPS
jgi:lipase chaperone LimK